MRLAHVAHKGWSLDRGDLYELWFQCSACDAVRLLNISSDQAPPTHGIRPPACLHCDPPPPRRRGDVVRIHRLGIVSAATAGAVPHLPNGSQFPKCPTR